MNKLFIYCSNNQAYHALINNSIVAKAIMKADFKSDTASFISENFVYLSKYRLSEPVAINGISDVYYPVVLEVSFDQEAKEIPALLVKIDAEGNAALSDKTMLDYAFEDENCLGAFICGEVPITFLSRIIFDGDDKKVSFKKSSVDLWFPEDLYSVWSDEPVKELVTLEVIRKLSEDADGRLDDVSQKRIQDTVAKRLRLKAASYYAIEATNDWSIGSLKTNIDKTLINFIDENSELQNCVKAMLGDNIEAFEHQQDRVFNASDSGDIERSLFNIITEAILSSTEVKGKVSEEIFTQIGGKCLDTVGESAPSVANAFQTIKTFLSSNMDPDVALKQIGPHDVLRAFMLFMDQQENADFLKRASTKLSQNERRYAYIMYGLLNGMYEVDRSYKSNRALEHQIEKVIMKMLSDEWLISRACDKASSTFMAGNALQEGSVFGIKPSIKKWYNVETSHEILMAISDGKVLEKIYETMSKTVKDDPIPEQDIYSLKEPITISVQIGEKTAETFVINRKADAKDFGKKIERLVKKEKEEFNAEGFKKYLADTDRYKKFYRKNTDYIQDVCGKIN